MTRQRALLAMLAVAGSIAFGILGYAYVTRFQGDGVYTVVTNALILRDHELVLPEFSLVEPAAYTWSFRGYCSDNRGLQFSLRARAENEIEWWQVDNHVAATMQDDRGQILLEKDSRLNAYHARHAELNRDGDRHPQEWDIWYPVVGPLGTTLSRVARAGIPSSRASYLSFLERLDCLRTYTIDVQVSEPATSHGRLVGHLRLVSGWK